MCHYRPSYGDYVLGWDSRHLRHANDYRAYWDPDYREYYREDDYASAAFFGGTTAGTTTGTIASATSTATSTASATATATSTALATTGGPSYVPALASAAALALVGSGLLALRVVLRRPGGS